MTRPERLRSALVVALISTAGCTAEPEAEVAGLVEDTTAAVLDTPPPPSDPLSQLTRVSAPPSRVERTFEILFVNPGPGEVVVQADAGAGQVRVDSVAAKDSSRVDLVVRSDSVRLLIERIGAPGSSSRVLRYPPDSARRIEFAEP